VFPAKDLTLDAKIVRMCALRLSSITEAVVQCVSSKRVVVAAYIFGSVVTGRMRKDSDIDIAVLLREGLNSSKIFQLRLKLMAELGHALRRSDIDVVILNEASPLLAHRVLSKGRLVFERSPSERIRFQVNTANRYSDLMPGFETYIRYLKKSVREGQIVG
jgi:predicted nucleotidyltransferase